MKFNEIIGIDVSKSQNEVLIHTKQKPGAFDNTKKAIGEMAQWAWENTPFSKDETLFVFEHTGIYSHNLSVVLDELGFNFIPVPGLEIKKSLGISRGKDDQVDAKKIALYGYRRREELEPYKMPKKNIVALKKLLSLRERLVRDRTAYKNSSGEQGEVLVKKEHKILFQAQERMIHYIDKQIKKVGQEMDRIINEDPELKKLHELITSIKGVGDQTSRFMIAYTAAFTKFDNARKFASYCGVAPFRNQSGSSIQGRTKVSNLANKRIKSLLELCARSALQHNKEIKAYYEKRIEKGENRTSTTNIIRNKLLGRIFAVVKRGTPYVETMHYATQN